MKEKFIYFVNKNSFLKKILLKIIDFYYEFFPLFIGVFIRFYAYLKNIFHTKIIAKPGILNYKGGAFNPGAIYLDQNTILLLAKAQVLPWNKARGNKNKFYLKGDPVVFLLNNKTLKTNESFVVKNIGGYPKEYDFALEDFRVFQWNGLKMINHSFVIKETNEGFIHQKEVRSALSVFDEKERKIIFRAFPALDFSNQDFEKNWIYKQNNNQLLLFYSLNPYRVLMLENEENFTFKTIINKRFEKLSNPGNFDTLVSYSTNPIDFDDQHWFLLIHQIKHKFTGRCYYHWGILINKFTLLPVKITSKPIFSGMGARGRLPGIRYISSVLKIENELLFFAGEGDVFITVTKKTIYDLNKFFIEV